MIEWSFFIFYQLGNLLGCVVGLKQSVTGITIIALGTSLPDTFASRTAAKHDSTADAAIGNITGKYFSSFSLFFSSLFRIIWRI